MSIAAKITGAGHYIPEREISNADVLARLEADSRPHLNRSEMVTLMAKAERKLGHAGCGTRYWCREDQFCTDIARIAGERALSDADIDPLKIDYLIFTGMSKAFVEPASAHVLRHGLGALNANVIDTQDACTSFIKSVQIGDSLIRSGVCKTVLIASGERTFDWADFTCTRPEDLAWKFGSLTIGDAAGAVVMEATCDPEYTAGPYHFDLSSHIVDNTFSVCNIGLNHQVGERYRLASHSKSLFDTAASAGLELIMERRKKDPTWAAQKIDRLLFHDIGDYLHKKVIPGFSPLFPNAPKQYFSYFKRLGNIASSSFPVGLCLSAEAGRLSRGDRVLFACPAGGVQTGLLTFVY